MLCVLPRHPASPSALADLGALVRIPSIAFPGFDPANVQRSAEAVAELVRGTGLFETVDIRRAAIPETAEAGQPAVLATRAARNGRPTILLYAHHDVQPVGDEALWESPPFEPTIRGGRLYGRGAADDKAGIMAHVAALRALTEAVGPDFDLGVVLFFEGEEEAGSRSFAQFLSDNAADLRADVIVVADSGNWDDKTPALTVSLRGNTRFTLRVRTLEHASHSGMFGGAVPDAMMATVKLLATLWDDDGAVAVEGLTERDAETPPYSEETLRDEAGLPAGVSPIGSRHDPQPHLEQAEHHGDRHRRAERRQRLQHAEPGDHGRDQRAGRTRAGGEGRLRGDRGAPARARAVRRPAHLHRPGLRQSVPRRHERLGGRGGARRARTRATASSPVDIGVGGSIPFIADLVREFPGAQILVTGVEDPHARAHSPNESLHLATFRNARPRRGAAAREARRPHPLSARPTGLPSPFRIRARRIEASAAIDASAGPRGEP